MIETLDDVWIVTESGITCWDKHEQYSRRGQLMGMLICALNGLAKKISTKQLHNFEVGKKRFYILKKNNLFFVGTSSNEIEQDEAEKQLEIISEKFLNYYPEEIFFNWDSDISLFNKFSKFL